MFPSNTGSQGPVLLIRNNGTVKSYGTNASTEVDRGTALMAARSAAVAGETIVVRQNCKVSGDFKKNDVKICPLPGVKIKNTSDIPAITAANFSSSNVILNRRRDVYLYSPEPEFCFWNMDFHTTNNPSDVVYNVANSSYTKGNHKLVYTGGGGASSGSVVGYRRFKTTQLVAKIRVEAHNNIGSYNDVGVGFGITTSSSSMTLSDSITARYRRTAGNATGYIELAYSHSGGSLVYQAGPNSGNLTAALTFPFDLMLIMNHGTLALAVSENGVERILHALEINISHWNMESQTLIDKLVPIIFYQSDAVQSTAISQWSVHALGTLGDREHYVATYEDGEPIQDSEGNYYITADACHVCDQSIVDPTENSAFMRNQSTTRLWNADVCRFTKATAKYVVKKGTKSFGAQQGKVVFDRHTGLYHWYSSEWNDTTDRVQMIHYATYQNILHGYWVIDGWNAVDIATGSAPFTANNFYDTDVIKWNGLWYLCGTIATGDATSRTSFCLSGTQPDVFHTFVFLDDETDEGTRFWVFGGQLYVVTGCAGANGGGGADIKIMDMTGSTVRAMSINLANRYPHQLSLLPVVKYGKTQYQAVGFSDYNGGSQGEDYKADYPNKHMALTFGPTVAIDLGTFSGEEFTTNPKFGVYQ